MARPKKDFKSKTNTDKVVGGDIKSKLAAVKAALAKNGASMLLDVSPDVKTPRISSGILSVDDMLNGGIMQGKITEFFGEESSGKSLVSMLTIAEAQRQGKTCMLVDVEYGFDHEWASKLGVNCAELIRPDIEIDEKKLEAGLPMDILTAEKIFQIIFDVALTRSVDMIVVDSIAAMITEDEYEKELTEDRYASLAKKLKEGLGKVIPVLAKTGTSLILINQVRDDIGSYVKSVHTPGGRALKHLISTRVMFKKATTQDMQKVGDSVKGVDILCKTIKHRGGANFKSAVFRLWYETGFDKDYDLYQYLTTKGAIVQNGAHYTFEELDYYGEAKIINAIKTDIAVNSRMRQKAIALMIEDNKINKEAVEPEAEEATVQEKEEE